MKTEYLAVWASLLTIVQTIPAREGGIPSCSIGGWDQHKANRYLPSAVPNLCPSLNHPEAFTRNDFFLVELQGPEASSFLSVSTILSPDGATGSLGIGNSQTNTSETSSHTVPSEVPLETFENSELEGYYSTPSSSTTYPSTSRRQSATLTKFSSEPGRTLYSISASNPTSTMDGFLQKSLDKASEAFDKATGKVHYTSHRPASSGVPLSEDIFASPIGTGPPPAMMKVRENHPAPRTGIATKGPLQTNKFYANLFLGDQRCPIYTFPYSIAWAGGKGPTASWGLTCSHVNASQRVFGQQKASGAVSYFINPVGIQSLVLSARELGNDTALSVDSMTAFSARAHLSKDANSPPAISFPLVQGMPYITAEYSGSTPLIQTGVFFKTVTRVTRDPKPSVAKFTFTLEDGATWRIYAYRTKGDDLDLKVMNNSSAGSMKPFTGIIQIAKDPMTPGSEAALDDGAGIYPLTLDLSGTAKQKEGSYTFKFRRDGHQQGNLYMYALPHHVNSFHGRTRSQIQPVQLQTTTKGSASLVRGDEWTMVEPGLPIEMDFAPWHPEKGPMRNISDRAKDLIRGAAAKEISQNMMAQSNLDSMYFSGKALAKFALILYVINDLLEDKSLFDAGIGQLKAAFGVFAANQQQFPLFYESAWGGVVSSATYATGNEHADFGNTFYNDHHFHYGYHILAGALIGHMDPAWLVENKEFVDVLCRDIANPSKEDKYFPLWRNFDWYHGHSWAHGLYPSMDGKNQESSSEDMMHAYALKMWGAVVGNKNLEARGNLQLSILSRAFQHYYLYQEDNVVQPKEFIGNKVAGILFENKIDHTTFFSPDIEAIQGIHMIPILPPTPFVRVSRFVKEEWRTWFSDGRIDNIGNAWKGIVYANYATIEPRTAFEFFAAKDFEPQWIDGGASLTWFLAYSAALGEA